MRRTDLTFVKIAGHTQMEDKNKIRNQHSSEMARTDRQTTKQLKVYSVRLTACFMAGIGPTPITEGSTPAWDQETILAKGFSIRLSASVFFIRTTAAAPSFIPENK